MINIFLKIISMSLAAGYIILAIMLIRLILRKAPKKFSFVLWIAAAFRLCCPISFESLFSLFNFGGQKVIPQVTYTMADYAEKTVVNAVTSPMISEATAALPGTVEQASRAVEQITKVPQKVPVLTTGFGRIDETIHRGALESVRKTAETNGMTTYETVLLIGTVVWVIGMLCFLIYGIVNDLKIRKRVQKAIKVDRNIYFGDEITSPFLFGIFRPRIYIPFGLADNEKEYILAHEKYHLKRKDHMTKLIAFLILMVHWFNPLVWCAFILMNKDLEMSCDEKIISENQDIKKAYSVSLLSFATGKRMNSPVSLSFGESSVKERVKNTLSWKKPKLWISVIAIIVCIVTLVACVSNPTTIKPEKIVQGNVKKAAVKFSNAAVKEEKSGSSIAKFTKETYRDGDFTYTHDYRYDVDGKLLCMLSDDINGHTSDYYQYDADGKLIEIVHTYYDGDHATTAYTYDINGNVTKTDTICPGVMRDTTNFVYDGRMNLRKTEHIIEFDEERYPPEGEVKFYDDQGKIIGEWGEDENNSEYEIQYEYEYDENGAVKFRHKKTSYVRNFAYEYDAQGRKTKKSKLYFNGEKDITAYEYDHQGNVINEVSIYSSFGEYLIKNPGTQKYDYQIDHGYEKEYDNNGNLIREVFPNTHTWFDYALIEKKYVYNEHGDIIKEIMNYLYPQGGYMVDEVTEYGSDGKEIKRTEKYLDGSQRTTLYVYDSDGNLLKEENEHMRVFYMYDGNGNLIKKICVVGTYLQTYEYSGYVNFDNDEAEKLI